MEQPQQQAQEKFESWGVLELFGHLRLAGKISEQTIGGVHFLRIDVPAIEGLPGYTRYFTGPAIYSLTPTTEEMAHRVAHQVRARPVQVWDMPARLPGPDDV